MDVIRSQYGISEILSLIEEEDAVVLTRAVGVANRQQKVMVVLNDATSSVDDILMIAAEMTRLSAPMVVVSSSAELQRRFYQERLPPILDSPVWYFGQEVVFDPKIEDPIPDFSLFMSWLTTSRRPILVMGIGAERWITEPILPFVVVPESMSRFSGAHPLFMGRFGMDGDRCGNLAVQNADLIIIIGTLHFTITPAHCFAREAFIVQIGASTVAPHMHLSVRPPIPRISRPDWIHRCRQWKDQWMNEHLIVDDDMLEPYLFFSLFYEVNDRAVIVARSSDAVSYPAYQQCPRFFHMTRMKDAISYCQGLFDGQSMILFLGDTDLCRLQDLHALADRSIPLTIFSFSDKRKWVADEDGWIQRDEEGEDIQTLSEISGVPVVIIQTYDDIASLELSDRSPLFVDVVGSCSPHPIGSSDHPLEDMFPLIPECDLRYNMVIEPVRRTERTTAT